MVIESHRTYPVGNTLPQKTQRVAQTRSVHLQMSRVTRRELRYDDELAESGQIRSYHTEWVVTDHGLRAMYRETAIENNPAQFDSTPWWSRKKTARRKKS